MDSDSFPIAAAILCIRRRPSPAYGTLGDGGNDAKVVGTLNPPSCAAYLCQLRAIIRF